MIDLLRFRAVRKSFSRRYREDIAVEAAKAANELADEIGDKVPVDTGSFKDSWNASVGNPDLFWYSPKEHYNPFGDPDGTRIPEVPGAVPWGVELHVSAHSPYGPIINSDQVGRRPIPEVVREVAELFALERMNRT